MQQRRGARRLVWVSFIACAAVLVVVGITRHKSGASPSATTATRPVATSGTTTVTGRTATATSPTATAPVHPAVDPGLLPQTPTMPSSGTALTASMQTLWNAIVADSPSAARPVFFPEAAYLKMKTGRIPDPASDYRWRLIAFYHLDIGAYHAHLGASPSAAKLVAVHANPALAAWIPAAACENSIGYWHMPGTRLVYEIGGRTYSVRVASLISWRGVWYVVHLGPNPRPVNAGTVDDPQIGPGVPGPAGGC